MIAYTSLRCMPVACRIQSASESNISRSCIRLSIARIKLSPSIAVTMASDALGDVSKVRAALPAVGAAPSSASNADVDAADAPAAAPLQYSDLAQLDGHAARCVGSLLSGMIGDVLGEMLVQGYCGACGASSRLAIKLQWQHTSTVNHTTI